MFVFSAIGYKGFQGSACERPMKNHNYRNSFVFISFATIFFLSFVLVGAFVAPSEARADAELLDDFGGPEGFGTDTLPPNDDESSDAIALTAAFPNGVNFFGRRFSEVYVNNNGNISFGGAVSNFTPEPFPMSQQPIIAPWWADVDTRRESEEYANTVTYHLEASSNRFVTTWLEVGYYNLHIDFANSFQLILTDRSDVQAGDFDIEFRYNQCDWVETDEAYSGGGGLPAQAGFDAGNGVDYVELPGSMTTAVRELCDTSNVDDSGVWRFYVRNGDITACGNLWIDEGEDCDDGGITATCDGDCTFPACGDGFANPLVNEQCDDGNTADGDGCSGLCETEDGWDCHHDDATGADVCESVCGDGLMVGAEECDDGNTSRGDGCSSLCTLEADESVGLDQADEPDVDHVFRGGGISACSQWRRGPTSGGGDLVLLFLVGGLICHRKRRHASLRS